MCDPVEHFGISMVRKILNQAGGADNIMAASEISAFVESYLDGREAGLDV